MNSLPEDILQLLQIFHAVIVRLFFKWKYATHFIQNPYLHMAKFHSVMVVLLLIIGMHCDCNCNNVAVITQYDDFTIAIAVQPCCTAWHKAGTVVLSSTCLEGA